MKDKNHIDAWYTDIMTGRVIIKKGNLKMAINCLEDLSSIKNGLPSMKNGPNTNEFEA